MNILIIEDEPAIRQTLTDLLELNGHAVFAAADGGQGLKLAERRPELILCDIGLPDMDGYQVVTAIQQNPESRDIPFIFLTARAERADQRRGMALGADDYITKPFTERDILDAIDSRIRRQQPLRDRIGQLVDARHREIGAHWSHELMTPLNGILCGLELIEKEADHISPAELKELLGLIRSGAERQQALSRKLVRFFELERLLASPVPAGAYRCDADKAIVAGAIQTARAKLRENDLRLDCEPGGVALSKTFLSDAISELVENALVFSSRGQTVGVSGHPVGQTYRIEVVDAGPGMTPEQRASTEAFKQFNRHMNAQQGLGLGLAIARNTAATAGGRLLLMEGPQGAGLKVVMDLPLASSPVGRRDASEIAPQPGPTPIR